MQDVPPAIGVTGDQAPLAQRWKEDPPIQFHIPSWVQAPVMAPAPLVPEELDPPAGAGLAADGAADGAATGAELGIGVATTELVAGIPLKMPPVAVAPAAAEVAGAEAAGAEAVGAEALPAEPLEEPPEERPELPAQFPTGGRRAVLLKFSSDGPGLGNSRSPSAVLHPLPMFATNMSGKSARFNKDRESAFRCSIPRFLEPGVTVSGAQFMYISLFPILLNQVQANTYCPGVIPSGTVKV